MATCTPWLLPLRPRLRLDVLPSRLWRHACTHLNGALHAPSPAALEIDSVPYPTALPDVSIFESMSAEYNSVSTPRPQSFTPLTSSDTLLTLVSKRDLGAAEALRKEMLSHHIPIPHHVLYLRAALYALTEFHPKASEKERLDAFEAWLLLTPDRSGDLPANPFYHIRRRLFRSMNHLNLDLIYRFGLIIASKGYYSGHAAMQAASTLARYAQPLIVGKYLRDVEVASRDYHSRKDTVPPSDLLAGTYNLSIRTVALRGMGEAALGLVSMAHSRGIHVPHFTLNFAAKHAPDQKAAIDRIQAIYPSWTMQDTNTYSARAESETSFAGQTADVAVLATRLRSLRHDMRSPCPPSPHALRSFITSYQALGRTRALTLLRSLAYRKRRSASTWAFTRMLHHRSQREPIHLLYVFFYHFHLVGVPQKQLLSHIRRMRGQPPQKDVERWVGSPWLMHEKLWPSPYHTALVWEALVLLAPKGEKEALYALLLSLVRKSKRLQPEVPEADRRPRMQLPRDAYDDAHFAPFVASLARGSPGRAAKVVRDMIDLGIEPSVVQWSMVARGYAQHNDPAFAFQILDRLEDVARCSEEDLLGVHTNVLRGFVLAGDVEHARAAERRLVTRFGYQVGTRPATDASIELLRRLEGSL